MNVFTGNPVENPLFSWESSKIKTLRQPFENIIAYNSSYEDLWRARKQKGARLDKTMQQIICLQTILDVLGMKLREKS